MKPLRPSERFHVEAAKGWLELGNTSEAEYELNQMPAVHRAHPEVLKVRWRIHARRGDWKACLYAASQLQEAEPDHLPGWLYRATSLEHLGRSSEARRVLGKAMGYLGKNPVLAFHMAELCAHQPGTRSHARHWVCKAMELATDPEAKDWLRLEALKDPLLECIWTDLHEA